VNKLIISIGILIILITILASSCSTQKTAKQPNTSLTTMLPSSSVQSPTPSTFASVKPTPTSTFSIPTNVVPSAASLTLSNIYLSGPGLILGGSSTQYKFLICAGSVYPDNDLRSDDKGLVAIDIHDPNNPTLVSYLESGPIKPSGTIYGMTRSIEALYIATQNYLWEVNTLGSGDSPIVLKTVGKDFLVGPNCIANVAGTVYFPDLSGIFGLNSNTQHIAEYMDLSENINSLLRTGIHTLKAALVEYPSGASQPLLTALSNRNMYIIYPDPQFIQASSISNPFPVPTPVLPHPGPPNDVSQNPVEIIPAFIDISSNTGYVYIVTPYTLLIVDIRNPETPSIVAQVNTKELTKCIAGIDIAAINTNKIYLLSSNSTDNYLKGIYNTLEAIDITDPTNPREVGTIKLTEKDNTSCNILAEEINIYDIDNASGYHLYNTAGHLYYATSDDNYQKLKVIDLDKAIFETR
jgi:hypothetical protein